MALFVHEELDLRQLILHTFLEEEYNKKSSFTVKAYTEHLLSLKTREKGFQCFITNDIYLEDKQQ